MRFSRGFEWSYRFLASKKLAAGLFLFLCLVLIPRTFWDAGNIYLSTVSNVLIGLMGLNLATCTLRRMKTLPKSVLVIHLGAVIVLAGAVISSLGFVATVNIYEGTVADTAYRWDIKQDMPLGVDLTVRKINMEYYPVSVKVGVLKGKEKFALFVLKTGESFNLEGYNVRADSLDFPSENLRLSIYDGGRFIGSADATGASDLPPGFPYEFKLVAYKNPSVKRAWLDLALSRGSGLIAEGTTEVNRPFTWGELNFYNTKISADSYGMPFAGIQISKDPGKPYVFFGLAVLAIGSVMYLFGRLYGTKL